MKWIIFFTCELINVTCLNFLSVRYLFIITKCYLVCHSFAVIATVIVFSILLNLQTIIYYFRVSPSISPFFFRILIVQNERGGGMKLKRTLIGLFGHMLLRMNFHPTRCTE